MNIDDPLVLAEVEAASDRYEAALQSNDLDTLDASFWQDSRVMRVSAKDELQGIENIRRFRAGRPPTDAARDYLSRDITCFGDHSAIVNITFLRKADTRVGRQTQTWVRFNGSWRIVSAHISFREIPNP
ncbi:oxalurate catabolism protein HpxZ [Uliginosibacterium sp. H3]|uniref:Oxalurate catabolism protein HpxZ n=1 Tax=Uliginosibacterium silvisoli TaxID=3114758 RepID=A0ABU6JYQ8_9RHOO|nr:oxalurate catabolism protein HpxZ [Uliginosibacterium sp. H3]